MGLDIDTILQQAQAFQKPQDLRHAIFSIQSRMKFQNVVKAHLKEIRATKKCVVTTEKNLSSVQLTFENGILASVKLHELYPNVSFLFHSANLLNA